METTFLFSFTLSFLFVQTYGASSSNTMITTSSNVTCIQRERQSLLVFRQGLSDKSNRLSTWTGVECCEWRGVGCDWRTGHVVKLDLRSPSSLMDYYSYDLSTRFWLEGKVSPSLLNLKHLRHLDLSMNNFSGQNIPEFFGSFKYLEYLNLSYSRFSGAVPPHLGNLSRLKNIDLNANNDLMLKNDMRWVSLLSSLKHLDFSGITIGNHIDWLHPVNMLPSLITLNLASCDINIASIKVINFTSLNSLDLSYNYINSTIPVWLSNLTGLVHLDLGGNSFHGGIPDSIGSLGSLSSMDLSFNRLSDPIPPSLGGLSSLKLLSLGGNKLSGSIPESIGLLTRLQELYLWGNQLNGNIPESIGLLTSLQLKRLQVLWLSGNQLNGSIPESIGLLTSLQTLSLSENQLSGNIPTSLGQLSNLQYLYLSRNKLNGSIPESIGLLTSLQTLSLWGNELNGSIPESIGLLTSLQSLWLDGNQLSGVVCEDHFTKLYNLTYLDLSGNSLITYLYLSRNKLNGSIPESIGLLTSLQTLSLWGNELNGSIPESIGLLTSLQSLWLDGNQLSGVVCEDHFTKLYNLTYLDLSGNSLITWNVSRHWIPPFQLKYLVARSCCNMGPQFPNWLQTQTELRSLTLRNSSIRDTTIPEWFHNISSHLWRLDLSDNQIGGNLPRIIANNNTGLQLVNLGNNRFNGSIPAHLCEKLSIIILDLSNNNFSGFLPMCLGNLIQLQAIDLTNNTITGDIPSSLGSLSQLRSLHLHNNKFQGNITAALHNLIDLETLDLGNNLLTCNIPSWIGKSLSKLRILNLQSNKLTGKIPTELCQINHLQHLNLANNSITGNIPHCFGNLTGMITSDFNFTYDNYGYEENVEAYIKGIQLKYTKTTRFLVSLDLSNNKIDGEILDVLMNLISLKSLNLSRNLLSGHIPKSIGNIKSMESLDLSNNKLSGQIPPSMGNLIFLSYLNLSFNKLFGPIPVGNQFNTFNDPTMYEGNNGLCGKPLPRNCKESNLLYTHVGDGESKDSLHGLSWFYTGMVSGFVIGFMGLIGSLHFIRIWRITYFEMIENVCSWLTISILVTLARIKRKSF